MTEPKLLIPEARPERERPYQPPAVINDVATVMQIIERMVREPAFDPERIKQMLDLKDRWQENEARKAFVADMAEFKRDPPKIYKNKHVGFDSRDGRSRTEYDHATHSEVTMKIVAALAGHGFSHRWVTTQPNGQVCVECIITHRLGHSESQSLTAPPDTSGLKSPVQAIASTRTLLERYTLLGATGLSAADLPDADDRVNKSDKPTVPEDVWLALSEAAQEGEASLRRMWETLSDATRDTIFDSFASDWSELKDKARRIDADRKGIDTATAMRQLMQKDIEESDLAAAICEENDRLNRDEIENLNTAWQILSAAERRAWKDWVNMGKQHGKH